MMAITIFIHLFPTQGLRSPVTAISGGSHRSSVMAGAFAATGNQASCQFLSESEMTTEWRFFTPALSRVEPLFSAGFSALRRRAA
jgi:hypothetical protein